jgi:hypothetical protein
MTFTAIVTCHRNLPGLRTMLGNLIYQTRKPDEIRVYFSDVLPSELADAIEDFAGHGIVWLRCDDREDWGHEKRARGVAEATGDYLGFFNDDDSYSLDYVERLMSRAELGVDAVWCDWNEIPNCDWALCSSTSGNYVIRAELARQVGYQHRAYEADGLFIEDLKRAGAVAAKVPELPYFHNVQEES